MSTSLSNDDLIVFNGLLEAGNELIAADFLEELDIEYYTEISRQLRGEYGKWLGNCIFYTKTFDCFICKLQPAYGYKFSLYERHILIKESLYFMCESCRDIQIQLHGAAEYRTLKVQSI